MAGVAALAWLVASAALPGAQACTFAPPTEGHFFLPVDSHRAYVSQGHRIGLWDVEHGAWQGVPLQQWTGQAAADPAGGWLVASIVDDAYRHHCGEWSGTGREEPRARATASDGTLRTLATDVRWLAGSEAGVAIAHGKGPDARVDVHAWGAWDAPAWTAPVGGWHGALAPSGDWLLQVDAHPPVDSSVLRLDGRDGTTESATVARTSLAAFSPDSTAVALLQRDGGGTRVQLVSVPGMADLGAWSAGPGRVAHTLAWGPAGIAVVTLAGDRDAQLAVLAPGSGAGQLALRHQEPLDAGPASLAWMGGAVAYWNGGVRTVPLEDPQAEPSAASPGLATGLAVASVGLAVATRGSRRD